MNSSRNQQKKKHSLANSPIKTTPTNCCLCSLDNSKTIGNGKDFEYFSGPNTFHVKQCNSCGLVYLNPRPDQSEFTRIYPNDYHSFDFSETEFGFVYNIRRKLEAKRLLRWCQHLTDNAHIIDIGCGDGFHLELLQDFGNKRWKLEGVDADTRAASIAEKKGIKVHCGLLETLDLPQNAYDLAILIQTIEHVADPPKLLQEIRTILKPGGKVCIVTDNTDSLDFHLSKKSYWGGYHFPRHWNLFNKKTIQKLAEKTEMEVESLTTQVSPVNWVYSIRNRLTDKKAPDWLIEQFSLKSTVSLGFFTIFDTLHNFAGRGALLNAVLKRPL